jgi:hypothetical protein
MTLDTIAKLTWGRKVRKIKEKIDISSIDYSSCQTLENYLDVSNRYACIFLKSQEGNFLKNFHNFQDPTGPSCRHYSMYTYATFSLIIEKENLSFDKYLTIMAGAVAYQKEDKVKGAMHMWLGIEDDISWDPYEAIPGNRDYTICYRPSFCLELSKEKAEVTLCHKTGASLLIANSLNPFNF